MGEAHHHRATLKQVGSMTIDVFLSTSYTTIVKQALQVKACHKILDERCCQRCIYTAFIYSPHRFKRLYAQAVSSVPHLKQLQPAVQQLPNYAKTGGTLPNRPRQKSGMLSSLRPVYLPEQMAHLVLLLSCPSLQTLPHQPLRLA